tara:strand:+ start:279 stop:452 length:174 start_codon:yes stop_codon:yes gene_type:complete
MDKNYSIEEILLAVEEIRVLKKEKDLQYKTTSDQKIYSSVPTKTLKLIEEAEKYKEE